MQLSSTAFDIFLHGLRQARIPALVAALVCLIPFATMQFAGEVNWTGFDFAVAFSLLFSGGFAHNLLVMRIHMTCYKLASGLTVGTAVFLLFLNGAVGFVGSENNAINLIFPGVLATGIFVTFFFPISSASPFCPAGMSRALLATGLAQAAAAVTVLAAGGHHLPGASVADIVALTGFFMALWFVASYFFRRAAAEGRESTTGSNSA